MPLRRQASRTLTPEGCCRRLSTGTEPVSHTSSLLS